MGKSAKYWLIALASAGLFLFALFSIALEPAVTTDLYPKMSTLRADPVGAKALYDSIAEMPGMRVERDFKPLPIDVGNAAVVLLGHGSHPFREDGESKMLEKLADTAGRLVIVFEPEQPDAPAALPKELREEIRKQQGRPVKENAEKKNPDSLAVDWGIEARLHKGTWDERSDLGRNGRETALYFEPIHPSWKVLARDRHKMPSVVERPWKSGSILLVSLGYPLSNEGLRDRPDTKLIATMIGPFERVVFSEWHLGIRSTGSVGSMLRRYGMTGAAAMLLILGLLFIWKMSSSLLPPKQVDDPKRIEGEAAQDGLAFLIRRAIPKRNLLAACWQEWERSTNLRPHTAAARQARAKEALDDTDPVRGYKNIQKALTEQS